MPSPILFVSVVILIVSTLINESVSQEFQIRASQNPLSLLTHLHLKDADEHRLPAFVITQVSHSKYIINFFFLMTC